MTRLSTQDLPTLTALAARATAIEDAVAAQLGMTFAPKGGSERTRAPGHARIRERARQDPALWARWQEGERLRWQIALTMQGVVIKRACAIHGPERGPDVAAEALPHLFTAAVSWQPTRGAWTTHAKGWIRAGLQRGARPYVSGIDRSGRLAGAMGRIAANPGKPLEELATDDVPLETLRQAEAFRVMSLDRRMTDDDGDCDRWVDRLVSDAPPTDEAAERLVLGERVQRALEAVRVVLPRSAVGLAVYYSDAGLTNTEIGARYLGGVSRERVRQIIVEGERCLRFLVGVDDCPDLPARTRRALLEVACG